MALASLGLARLRFLLTKCPVLRRHWEREKITRGKWSGGHLNKHHLPHAKGSKLLVFLELETGPELPQAWLSLLVAPYRSFLIGRSYCTTSTICCVRVVVPDVAVTVRL